MTVFVCAIAMALGACSYIPKPQSSVDPLAGEVKSTASIPTNSPRRPLD